VGRLAALSTVFVGAACIGSSSPASAESGHMGGGPAGQDGAAQKQEKAAEFSAMGSDGKTYTLASFDKSKPLVLVFIKDGCGAVPTSFPFFNAIAEAFEGDKAVQYVGVIDDDADAFATWSREHRPRFTFLLDPDKKIIGAYGIKASNEVKVIQGGLVTKHYKSFSRKSFTEIGATLTAAAEAGKERKLDFSRAPERERFG